MRMDVHFHATTYFFSTQELEKCSLHNKFAPISGCKRGKKKKTKESNFDSNIIVSKLFDYHKVNRFYYEV